MKISWDCWASCLPAECARCAFERAFDVRGDPATVEVARLGLDAFAIHGAFLDAVGVESEVVAERSVRGGGVGVGPGGIG